MPGLRLLLSFLEYAQKSSVRNQIFLSHHLAFPTALNYSLHIAWNCSFKRVAMKDLSSRFEFDEDALVLGDPKTLRGTLWRVYDRKNGSAERRLRTWRKTNSDLDIELRSLWRHEMRQVSRIMRYRDAADVIVDIIEEVEDEDEFALLLADRGEPIKSAKQRRNTATAPRGAQRILIWQNLERVARALGILHDQAIVHGRLTHECIFTEGSSAPDFRLSGFEWSVRLGVDTDDGPAAHSWSRFRAPCSFYADWAALGNIAADLLCETANFSTYEESGSQLTSSERRLLRLLISPRAIEPIDARIVVREITNVIEDLKRSAGGRFGALVLFPSPAELSQAIADYLDDALDPDDFGAQLSWLEDDLSDEVRIIKTSSQTNDRRCTLVTDTFRYTILPMHGADSWQIGYLAKIIRNDGRGTGTDEPEVLGHPVQVFANKKSAIDSRRALWPSAIDWEMLTKTDVEEVKFAPDVRDALFVIEIVEATAETLNAFPVSSIEYDQSSHELKVSLECDAARKALLQEAGMRPDIDRLSFLLEKADDAVWRLSSSPKLGRETSWDIELEFLRIEEGENGKMFVFEGDQAPSGQLFLKPPRDQGQESATRRRIRNIAKLRGRTDVVVGLDDPWKTRRKRPAQELAELSKLKLDPTKTKAADLIAEIEPYVCVVGPPGVGKTYLATSLISEILENKTDARILVAAQSHEALKNLDEALRNSLDQKVMIVRIGNEDNRFDDIDNSSYKELKSIRESTAISGLQYRRFRESIDNTLAAHKRNQRTDRISRLSDFMLVPLISPT
ncbi:putative helicase protein ATP-binding [Roseibium sp. TrichSKD4]|nr:putative helicase protein ATP-binding [Roseibium sp. TrichSKD4]